MNDASFVKLAVPASIALNVLAVGLGTSLRDVTSLRRQSLNLASAALVMCLLMPCFAILIASLFDLEPPVRIAMVVLSVSPVLPLLPRKELKGGAHAAYAFSLYAWVAVLALAFVPAGVALGRAFGFTAAISIAELIRFLMASVMLPLALGIAMGTWAPTVAARLIGPAGTAAMALLVTGLIPLVGAAWRSVADILGSGAVLAFLGLVVGGLILGELFGGPDLDDRTVLASSNASRHPGIVLAIVGATFPGDNLGVVAAVLVYLVVNALVSVPYLRWNRHYPTPIGTRPAVARR